MNPPAKKALGRSIGDTVLAGLALLLVKYFGPEPEKASKPMDSEGIIAHVTKLHENQTRHMDTEFAKSQTRFHILMLFVSVLMIFTAFIAAFGVKQKAMNTTPAPVNFNAMPPPIETPVVLFTRSGHWHKAVRDSLGVDRNYETWERINNAIGWMKP